jgi:protein O-GlcNAc transferase
MGAPYIQYIFTDNVTSPLHFEKYYSEKFIYLPDSFLANSFAYQPEISPPRPLLDPDDTPQVNGCGGAAANFVYCSFNKHLKFDPHTFRNWLKVLEAVDGSVLCLLEYPVESKANLRTFVTQHNKTLAKRVRFQPFLLNPYDNQRRVVSMCNAVLDTKVYNGHTTSVDALWGGVPVVTLSTGVDMYVPCINVSMRSIF